MAIPLESAVFIAGKTGLIASGRVCVLCHDGAAIAWDNTDQVRLELDPWTRVRPMLELACAGSSTWLLDPRAHRHGARQRWVLLSCACVATRISPPTPSRNPRRGALRGSGGKPGKSVANHSLLPLQAFELGFAGALPRLLLGLLDAIQLDHQVVAVAQVFGHVEVLDRIHALDSWSGVSELLENLW
jgi:hypothetical protein